jgi:hypothetical protein
VGGGVAASEKVPRLRHALVGNGTDDLNAGDSRTLHGI